MLSSLRRVREAWVKGAAVKAAACDNSSHGSDGGSAAEDASTGSGCFALDDVAAAAASGGDAPPAPAPRRAHFTLSLRRDLAPLPPSAAAAAAADAPAAPHQPAGGMLAAAKAAQLQQQQPPAAPAAAAQRRSGSGGGGRLDPRSTAYQVSVLLSPSTFFEHKMQSDALRALRALRGAAGAPGGAAAPAAGGQGAAARWGACASGHGADVARVALALRRWGYTLIVRRVVHSTYWTKSFHNTFIVALDTSSGAGVEYIVDPHFKDKFWTSAPGEGYRATWEALPPVLVAMPCQLQPVVQLICEEVEQSFLDAGRACPPWRGWAATINRFMSDQFLDLPVPGPGAGDAEIEAFVARCAASRAATIRTGDAAGTAACGSCCGSDAAAACSCGATAAQKKGGSHSTAAGGGGGSDASRGLASCASGGSGGSAQRRPVPQPLRAQVGFQAPPPPPPAFRSKASPRGGGRVAAAAAAAEAAAAAAGGSDVPLRFGPAQAAVRRVRSSPFIYPPTAAAVAAATRSSSTSESSSSSSSSTSSSSGGEYARPQHLPVAASVTRAGVTDGVTSDTDEDLELVYGSGSGEEEGADAIEEDEGSQWRQAGGEASAAAAGRRHRGGRGAAALLQWRGRSFAEDSDASTPFEESDGEDSGNEAGGLPHADAAAAAGDSSSAAPQPQPQGLLSASLQQARAREAQAAAFLAGIPTLRLPPSRVAFA